MKDLYTDDEPPVAFDVDRDVLRGLIRQEVLGAVRSAVEVAQIRDFEGLS